MGWIRTGWSFASSEGIDVSGGEGLILTGSVGSFYIRHTSGHEKTLVFVAGQAGLGGGPLPVGFDISHEILPTTTLEEGEILGWNRNTLTSRDLEGLFVVRLSVQGGVAAGGNIMEVEFNYNWHDHLGTARGVIAGMSVGAQCGVAFSAGFGVVTMVIDGRSH